MRTFDEIQVDVNRASNVNDAASLMEYAAELDALETPVATAFASYTRGTAAGLTGNYPSALEHLSRALAGYVKLDDRGGVAHVTVNMGIVYHQTGDFPSALAHFRRAMAMHEELGNRAGVARATGNMGIVYYSTGDHASALEHYGRALAVHEELGNRVGVALHTGNLGAVYASTSDYQSALEHYGRALALHEELGDRVSVARVTGNIVVTLLKLDRDDEAEELLVRQAHMQLEDPGVRSQYLSNRALLAEHRADLDAAQRDLLEALAIGTSAGLRARSAEYHERLRDLAQKRNDFAGFIENNAEFLRITEEVRGKEATQRIAMMEAERRMEGERRERDKERALLYGTLPEFVANRMLRGEKVSGDHYDHASVIFLDIVGFTSISERIPPGHVVHLLSQIFSALDAVCKQHGVTKIKTIGDSYMAVAGVPVAQDDHVHRAAITALVMLQTLEQLVITMPSELGDTSWITDLGDIQVRIGVHCGPVTAGVIGTERLQYDVWGDTVNVASRMESHGEPGRIHVSEAFATALRTEGGGRRAENDPSPHPAIPLSLHQRGTVDIKGKGPMTTYWLESSLP